MVNKTDIQEHAEVIGSDGKLVGVVDHLEGEDQIKLAKNAPESGGKHHLIPLSWVEKVENNRVVLNKSGDEAERDWTAV